MTLQIDIINQSTSVTDAELGLLLPALETQANRDFKPFWQTGDVRLAIARATTPGRSRILVLDNSDQAGDLGYHLDDDGTPEAKVFAAEDAKWGALLSVTLSHELLEMLADPTTGREFSVADTTYVVEVCDPVEADEDGYDLDGVRVSNFATPRYFDLPSPDQRYDFRGLLQAPIPALRPGGYIMFYRSGAWQSTMARKADGSTSHRARRALGRSRLRASLGAP